MRCLYGYHHWREVDMAVISEYRQNAYECRAAAESLKPGQGREQLLDVAAQWERLAVEREQRMQLDSKAA